MTGTASLAGFLLGGGLIVAIGAQNAFVLRQGLLRRHIGWICLFCAVSDAALIGLGVAGFGGYISRNPALLSAVTVAGCAFLAWYGFVAFRRVAHPQALVAASGEETALVTSLATCAAFTFLNPHVYLDTVVLVGGLSASYPGSGRFEFGLGAAAASFVWFFGLGYGARLLQPVFARPSAWRILDCVIGVTMWALAAKIAAPLL